MSTTKEIKELCLSKGADLVGITSTDRFKRAPKGFTSTDVLPDCRSVIVLLQQFPFEAMDMEPSSYTSVRNSLVISMAKLTKEVATALKTGGHSSASVHPISGKTYNGRFQGRISLKHAGELAGLGVIGKNYLLINNTFGNMIWLGAVLTSLELEADPLAGYTVCYNCNICQESCPPSAFDKELFSQKKCRSYSFKYPDKQLEIRCWNCRRVCPNRFGLSK